MRRPKPDPPLVMEPVTVTDPSAAVAEPLTVRIAAAVKLTGISRSKLYELIRTQDLETVKIGSSTLIIFESLRKMIERNRA